MPNIVDVLLVFGAIGCLVPAFVCAGTKQWLDAIRWTCYGLFLIGVELIIQGVK